jgi:hypothetical protein
MGKEWANQIGIWTEWKGKIDKKTLQHSKRKENEK